MCHRFSSVAFIYDVGGSKMSNKVCECCGQEIVMDIKTFDEAHAESVVVWDTEAKDIAEEWLYHVDSSPQLNSWESLKVYKLLDENVKNQIKRFYSVQ